MIQQVSIQNFQSHKETILNFSPGVNVILGKSDTGKSALFRAIIWCLYNRPLGDGFRSSWGGDTSTTITFDSKDTITRIKGSKSRNEYLLNDTVFKAFSHNPPEEIQQVCNLDEQLNIQTQIDPFFLLQSSPGEVARYLNKIAGLDDIDRVTKGIESHHRQLRNELTQFEQQLLSLQQDLKRFDGMAEVETAMKAAEALGVKNKGIESRIKQHHEAVYKARKLQERISESKQRLKIEPLLDQCLEIGNDIDSVTNQKTTLVLLLERIQRKSKTISQNKKRLRVKPALKNALSLDEALVTTEKQLIQLRKTLRQITDTQIRLSMRRKKVKEIQARLPKICPTCGSVLRK